jgi:uncharacterized protein
MDQRPVISVRGEADIEADPEIAEIAVTLQVRDRGRQAAIDLLAERNRHVLDLIRAYGPAVEGLESGAALVYPEPKGKGSGERVAAYVARASVRAVLSDFAVLGEMVTRLGESEMVTVAGPWWSLRPGSPVYRRARAAAAGDATLRAGDYAAAFGGRVGQLVEAADVGLLTGSGADAVAYRGRGGAGLRGGSADDAQAGLDFEPVKQRVTANLDARFTVVLAQPEAQ